MYKYITQTFSSNSNSHTGKTMNLVTYKNATTITFFISTASFRWNSSSSALSRCCSWQKCTSSHLYKKGKLASAAGNNLSASTQHIWW